MLNIFLNISSLDNSLSSLDLILFGLFSCFFSFSFNFNILLFSLFHIPDTMSPIELVNMFPFWIWIILEDRMERLSEPEIVNIDYNKRFGAYEPAMTHIKKSYKKQTSQNPSMGVGWLL